jgi:hypothetical protein
MKKLAFILMISLLLQACGPFNTDNELSQSLPGTYIRISQNEFGTEHDTLVIVLQNPSSDEYKLIRHWKYERQVDGQKLEPKYEIKITVAVLDKERSTLFESSTGDTYSYDEKQKILFNGPEKYYKR